MPNVINVIEPTLTSNSGHCFSFVESLQKAARKNPCMLSLWVARQFSLRFADGTALDVHPYFYRKLRRLQALFLYRRLLRTDEKIFVTTAGRTDFILLDWAAQGAIPPQKVFLYVHWVRPSERKLALFRKIAAKHPELTVMGPTKSVVDLFRGCGFRNAIVVPYPITPREMEGGGQPASFSHLLFAGAAREDKGFREIVDLLEHLAVQGRTIPFSLQTSADHYDKYGEGISKELARLDNVQYAPLCRLTETLDPSDYHRTFVGAICLQPYNRHDFADRISGITLDALSAGAPVVTLSGTWMARVVERFAAGVVVEDAAPATLLAASQTIIANYPLYRDNAVRAGMALQEENSAEHLVKALLSGNG